MILQKQLHQKWAGKQRNLHQTTVALEPTGTSTTRLAEVTGGAKLLISRAVWLFAQSHLLFLHCIGSLGQTDN